MFPLRPEDSPEPDVIGNAGADQARPRWRRLVMAGGMLALAGVVAAASLSQQHAAARQPGGVTASPSGPAGPGPVPSQAWVTSLNIANWPMTGTGGGLYSSMFAGGVAGNRAWELTLRNIAQPGQRCTAAVVLLLNGLDAHPSTDAYPISPHPPPHTPTGDLAFIALGAQSPGVGVGFLQLGAPAAQAWADPYRIGGLQISVPVLTERACGHQYYLAGFAYPLAGSLIVFALRYSGSPLYYFVPTQLSRPRAPGVWQSTG